MKMWDQIYLRVRRKAAVKKDKHLLAIMKDIANTPYSIKHDILKYYLSKCYELYNVAFVLWRKRITHKDASQE